MSTSPNTLPAHLQPDIDPAFYEAVIACFRNEKRRAIPARWLYDQAGSELFETITELPEYYPTRTETALLEAHCADAAKIAGSGGCVVEFGSGSSTKTPHLLRAVQPDSYVPIDISGDFLRQSAEALAADFPAIDVLPLEGDFMGELVLPKGCAGQHRLGFFPGSTIGNMVARTSVDLLRSMRRTLGTGAYLLIGIDRVKSPEILVPAYDDSQGVTAEFNYNLLRRINAELDGTIPVERFCHVARWNDGYARIEMHLEAQEDVCFEVSGESFTMRRGETIHTENSHKYGPRDARLMLRAGGWVPVAEWTDPNDWFALILAEAKPYQSAP